MTAILLRFREGFGDMATDYPFLSLWSSSVTNGHTASDYAGSMLPGSLSQEHPSDGPPSGNLLCILCAATMSCLLLGAPALIAQAVSQPASPPASQPASSTALSVVPEGMGVVSGIVEDSKGNSLFGAHLALSVAGYAAAQETSSDNDGHFRFLRVPPGAFLVTVTLPGFDTASASGTLHPAQSYELVPFTLSLASVNVTVDAVATPDELATEQMQAEEKQRIFGFLPNFFVSYQWTTPPLSTRQKYKLAFRNVIDPGNLFLVGTVSGVQQAIDAFPGYSQGGAGYGRRYGANLGNLVAGTFLGGAVLPSLFHQDPRYFYKGTGTVRARFFYAVSTAVICRGDNGHRQPAFAGILGDLSSGAVSNLYYAPSDRQGAALTFENGFLSIAGDAMNNVFQEFILPKLTTRAEKRRAGRQP